MSETGTAVAEKVGAPVVGLEFDEQEIVLGKAKELAIQCVVFVGNWLTPGMMRLPNYRLGGRLYPWPDFYTVPRGMVAKCAITRLQNAYRGIHMEHVEEKARPNWVQSYTLKNQWNAVEQKYEDVEVGTSGASEPLLYKAIKPVQELRGILKGGVVALEEDCGINSGADIKEAQFHYFPNWLEILSQKEFFPELLRDLEDHLRNRREQTNSANLRAIGDVFLASCVDYRDAAKAFCDNQTAVIREAEKAGVGVLARYNEVAERIFRELELTREDKLHENFAKNQNAAATQAGDITTAITLMSKILAKQSEAEAAAPPEAAQAPAPVTQEAAAADFDRSVEEVVDVQFHDMSEVVDDEDAEIAQKLETAGIVKTEPEEEGVDAK